MPPIKTPTSPSLVGGYTIRTYSPAKIAGSSPPSLPGKWVAGKGKLRLWGNQEREVEGQRLGTLFVHPGVGEDEGKWVLSHLPTGMFLIVLLQQADLLRIGGRLWSLWAPALRLTDQSELLATLPEEARLWIMTCRDKGGYVR